ncbi:MAG: hypothetical protein V2A73_02740 [Pseudomonadota bacterium]
MRVVSVATCLERDISDDHRVRRVQRAARTGSLVLEYGLGVLGMVGGAIVAADAKNVPVEDDSAETNPIGRQGAYGIAGGALAIGATALVIAIVDSLRALDRVEDLGAFASPIPGSEKSVSCAERPVTGARLTLRLTASVASSEARDVVLGVTDADGRLRFSWDVVPGDVLGVPEWSPAGRLLVADNTVVGEVALARARARVVEAAWKEAAAAGSTAAYRSFLERFRPPEAHVEEARQAYRKLRLAEIDRKFLGAIERADPDLAVARALLAEWETIDPQDGLRLERVSQVAKLALAGRESKVRELRTNLDAAIAAGNLVRARTILVEWATVEPQSSARAELEAQVALLDREGHTVEQSTAPSGTAAFGGPRRSQ